MSEQTKKLEALRLVEKLAEATSALMDGWYRLGDETDEMLTVTFPEEIGISFDEFSAGMWAWAQRVRDEIDNENRQMERSRLADDLNVVFDGSVYRWADTWETLSFNEAEALGLDATLRDC